MPETTRETLQGGLLLDRVRQLIHEGNVRRITVKQRGRTIAEFPLTVGVVGTIFAPILAAIGALTALLADCTIEVEHTEEPKAHKAPPKRGQEEEKKELTAVS
jgi:hypothetical protein